MSDISIGIYSQNPGSTGLSSPLLYPQRSWWRSYIPIPRRTLFKLRQERCCVIASLCIALIFLYIAFSYLQNEDTKAFLSRNTPHRHHYNNTDRIRPQHEKKDRNKIDEVFEVNTKVKPMAVETTEKKVNEEQGQNQIPKQPGNTAAERRDKIKEMMVHAWTGYREYAWGDNELRPASKKGHSASVFGAGPLGATIIDAMDTLHIMGLHEYFDEGRKWVEMTFDISKARGDLSVFETNIRFVGGLLSCYALTKDKLFLDKAQQIADGLLPAFDTPTGIPYAMVNLKTGKGKNWGWASGGSSILSEFGTLRLEFDYLSAMTTNDKYSNKIEKIDEHLRSLTRADGLYPNYVNPSSGKWGSKHVSVGALGDSFYEYLLKGWLMKQKKDDRLKQDYNDAIEAIERELIKTSKNGLMYIAEMKGKRMDHKMDHLACFIGGLFALQAVNEDDEKRKEHYMNIAREITFTCHESYIRTATRLGPESFRFTDEFEAIAKTENSKYYILRPEVIEAYFYLWRTTKEAKYREWAWDAAMAIETHCRTTAGFQGIRNVYDPQSQRDDVQQSFFLAETLKYLYLIFSDDDVISLDEWVFNTEAHPLPIGSLNGVHEQHVKQALAQGIL